MTATTHQTATRAFVPNRALRWAAIATLAIGMGACTNLTNTQERTLTGGAIGAGVGAAAGAVTGGCVSCGAVIGGAVGAGAGYLYEKAK